MYGCTFGGIKLMAGDWMKFELCTPDKPEVFELAGKLCIDPDAVVGKLMRVWGWFDQHTVDGHAPVTMIPYLDRICGDLRFCAAMDAVGWLEICGNTVALPNFDRHNGKPAKTRALTTERKRKSRENVTDQSRPQRDRSATREEKRREEKNKDYTTAASDDSGGGDCYLTKKKRKLKGKRLEDFERFWNAFDYRKDKATAADSWLDIPKLTPSLVHEIVKAAEVEASHRPEVIAANRTPQYAQGWVTARRWEDDIQPIAVVPTVKAPEEITEPVEWRDAKEWMLRDAPVPLMKFKAVKETATWRNVPAVEKREIVAAIEEMKEEQ
jgi:hypothetical protein